MKRRNINSVILFAVLVALVCSSCKKKIIVNDQNVENAVLIDKKFPLIDTTIFKTRKLIQLETNDSCLIGSITRIIELDNKIYIFDKKRQRTYIFNTNGEFISSIYHMGQGPGEYVQITDICLDKHKNQIIFLCSIPNKLMYFDLNGHLNHEHKLENTFYQVSVDEKFIYLLSCAKTNNNESDFSVYTIRKGTSTETPIMNANHEISLLNVVGNEFVSGKNTIFTRRYDNHIYRLKNGKVSTAFNIDFASYNFPESQKMENMGVKDFEVLASKSIYSIVNCFETNNSIIFGTNKSFIYLLDKKTKKIKQYTACMDSKFDFGSTNFLPIENTDNKIGVIYNSTYFEKLKKAMGERKLKIEQPELRDITTNMNSDSNPILCIYTFK
jgi:hypothetical protein